MWWLYKIRRRFFRARRRQWQPFMVFKRLGTTLAVALALALILRAWGLSRRYGSCVVRVSDAELVTLIDVHPRGDQLLVRIVKQGAPLKLGVVHLKRGTFTPLPERCTQAFFWSRDGQSILCRHYEGKGDSLFWYRPSGDDVPIPADPVDAPLSEVASHGSVIGTPSYNGERLLCFRGDSFGTRFAWWGEANGRRWERFPLPLGLTFVSENSPGFAPDGKQIALDWTIPLPNNAKSRRLIVGTAGGEWRTYNLPSDTSKVYWLNSKGVFVAVRNETVDVMRFPQKRATTVFRRDSWQPSVVFPSPGGTHVALTLPPQWLSYQRSENAVTLSPLVVVDVKGRKRYNIPETSGSAVWSRDGKTLYYARRDEVRALRVKN